MELTTNQEQNELKEMYIKWFVMHKDERALANLPLSPQEFADRYNTDISSIKEIHALPTFADDVYKATQKWAKLKVTQMAHLLVENYIQSKSPRDFDTYLKFIESGKESNNPLGQGNQINFFNLTPKQYEQILKRESKRYAGDSSVSEESGAGESDELLSAD